MAVPSSFVTPFLTAADGALNLASTSGVSDRWTDASALPEWTVGGVTAHLLGQIHGTANTLAEPVRGNDVVGLLEHYARVSWRGAPLDEDTSRSIRSGGEKAAAAGPAKLIADAMTERTQLVSSLSSLPGSAHVQPPWTGWMLTLDDFLTTRLLEICVHSDDVAYSVGLSTPSFPEDVITPVRHLLVDLAAGRHGDPAVLRALSRVERAPRGINAL